MDKFAVLVKECLLNKLIPSLKTILFHIQFIGAIWVGEIVHNWLNPVLKDMAPLSQASHKLLHIYH